MNTKRILLVDDEKELLKAIEIRLATWGYDVITATSGKEAISIAKKRKGSLGMIVLDYLMPEMDGISTLKEIREIDDKIPVIMFTAYPDKKSVEGAEELGVSAFVPKMTGYAESSLKNIMEAILKKGDKDAREKNLIS